MKLGLAAAALGVATCAVATWHTVTLWEFRDAVLRYRDSPGKGTVQIMGDAGDARYAAAWTYLAALAAAAAVFLTWLWRARAAADREHGLARGRVVWLATLLTAAWTVATYYEPDAASRVQQIAVAHTVLTVAQWVAGTLLTTLILNARRSTTP